MPAANMQEYYLSRLSPKQRHFAQNLIADPQFNEVRAAREAGYTHPHQAAAQLMKNPAVKQAVADAIRGAHEQLEVTSERVLREVSLIAFSDLADFVDENNQPRPLHDLPPDKRRAVLKVKVKRRTVSTDKGDITTIDSEIVLHPKMEALALLAKHLLLLQPDAQVNQIILSHDQALIETARETITDEAIREAATKDDPQRWLLSRWLTGMLQKLPGGAEKVREIVDASHRQAALAEAEGP
jgi:phage terminase small subunit